MTLHSVSCYGDCVVRKMKVMEEKSTLAMAALMVTQIHLTSWREQWLPHRSAVLSVIEHMDKVQRSSSGQPTVVMCRLGTNMENTCVYYFLNVSTQFMRSVTHFPLYFCT